jgi:polyisoprenoid-binding protein YceI
MRVQRLCAAVAIAALASASAAWAGPDPSKVEPGTYLVEPSHTRVMFALDHMGFTTYYGEFVDASGTLTLDPKNVSATRLDVKVPTATVSTTSGKLDAELKSADWLNAAKDPDIRFKSTKVVPNGPSSATVSGELTLHGVTRPVVLEAKLHGQGVNPMSKKVTVGFDVRGTIKRSEFGVKNYVPLIGDEVEITISAAFEKRD